MNLEKQKENFKNHRATFKDLGNIKILDFKKPNSTEYRIRFLFEEDYCRLHISGDLGELIAMNYRNMCWNQFDDFVNDIDYFQEKILCHSRPFFVYDQEQAEEDITKYIEEYKKHISGENTLDKREFRRKYGWSTLKYFHKELEIG